MLLKKKKNKILKNKIKKYFCYVLVLKQNYYFQQFPKYVTIDQIAFVTIVKSSLLICPARSTSIHVIKLSIINVFLLPTLSFETQKVVH